MSVYEFAAIILAIFLTLCSLAHLAILGIWLSLRKEMREMRTECTHELRAIGARGGDDGVSDAELEQAYKRGVMSAIQSQTQARAHNAPPSADSNSPSDGD